MKKSMKIAKVISTALLAPVILSVAASTSAGQSDAEIDALAKWLTGSFDTFEQAARDEANKAPYRHVRAILHVIPAQVAGMSERGRALYIEQALAETPDKPYRQGIYFIHRDERGAVVNSSYRLANPEALTGAWKDPSRLKGLSMDRLAPIAGCDIVLTRMADNRFSAIVGLHGTCKSSLRGATHMISQGEITPDYQITLDQGFDDAGNHKWGPPPGTIGHIFRRSGRN